jgi:aerobic-type carbon monoxide dehydrogenase small subunit (CoxS/CutS family)
MAASTELRRRKKKHLELTVNGRKVEADIDHHITLAEFLREHMDLTGTKVGCNRGECGSCTVIIDGMAVYSCTMLAIEAHGKEVLTIEGLADEDKLHPLQEAFVEHDALQCGYCTPGMILSVKALLDKHPSPTELDVRTAIDGNLCRCGSIPNVISAVLDVSRKMAEAKGGKQ